MIRGFSVGFRIPSTITCNTHVPGHVNHLSAIDHHHFVTTKLAQEVAAGRIAGPFTHPSPVGVVLSPLGVVPTKVPGQFRLIHDLSFPKDKSVNSHIAKLHSEVHCELLDDCVSIIREIGQGCLMGKADIKDAFRIIPIHPTDHRLLVMTWQDKYYFDKCLPMGCSTSCQTFESFAQALQWILITKFLVHHMSHILDDFIFFGPSASNQCLVGLQSFMALATSLHIPVNSNKTVLPTSLATIHGIEVDTTAMQLRLPQDKLVDAQLKINALFRRKKATLLALQSLIGTLNFACRVVVPGRAFLRRLIDLTRGVWGKSHFIRLNREARKDLAAWKLFLDSFNGVSLCLPNTWTSSNCIRLFSDASGSGFAAILGSRWFQGSFPSA